MEDVLCIEESGNRRTAVCRQLKSAGLSVSVAASLEEARSMIGAGTYRLILAHLGREDYSEVFHLCSLVRTEDRDRILVIVMDEPCPWLEMRLFDQGVSDVVAGVQACPELISKRVRAHLRIEKSPSTPAGQVALGDMVVDFDRCELKRGDNVCELSGVLLNLLWYLVCNPGRAISRQELSESFVWAHSICTPPAEGGKTFDIHIGRLRKLIEHDASEPTVIQSVRGIGWKLAVEPAWCKRRVRSALFS